MSGTFVIAQGGGPTAVINQTLAGAVSAIRQRHPGARILGARHGVRGLRDGNLVEFDSVSPDQLDRLARTPGAALGSTRDKPDAAYCEAVLKGLRAVAADAFIYIGGNDTAGTQKIIAEASGGSIACVHAPKTIDNDLVENDHTPGFISAAEFVAGAFAGADLDFRSLPGIYVGIVMGRHAGFLTAASAAWRMDADSAPHLVYVPERAFDRHRFIDGIKFALARHGHCIVAMSEGVSDSDGRSLVEGLVPPEMLERDPHGNVRLSGTDLGQAVERILAQELPRVRARVDTFGYLPRSHAGLINATDQREAFEAGAFAAEVADSGSFSVALQFDGRATRPMRVALGAVAGKTRHMPDGFLRDDRDQVSDACMEYLARLLPPRPDMGRPFV
ncbi:MAG: diphosphate--fructose-6-phosphate 1-phosphotransferase [Mesorhizobium sp.]|nr:diphosphate--fructose-6-phosphate 1-phosphotransferase [Mesorhizobium sp.]